MIKEIIMPKLGETMEEGYLVAWKKDEGDKIEKGDVLFEVMSDKTNFEVESLYEGYLIKKLYEPADEAIPVITVIGYIADNPDEKIPSAEKTSPPQKTEEKEETLPEPERVEEKQKKETSEAPPTSDRIMASPIARKTAEEAGVDISQIKGSGPAGRIEKKDVTDYIDKKSRSAEQQGVVEWTVKEWTPLKKIVAKRLSESKKEIPHFYFQGKFVADEVVKLKDIFKREKSDLTYTDFLIYIAARAIKEYPLINTALVNDEMRVYSQVDIGLAVSIEQGLTVPVLRGCEKKDIREISSERKILVERARSNKLSENDLKNCRFVISNLGMYGVENFQPIISPPGVAIMGVGKLGEEVYAKDGNVKIQSVMNVSFSFDHRVIDGSYAGLFYRYFKEIFENPALLAF